MTQRDFPLSCEVYGPGPSDFRLALRKPIETRDERGRYYTVADIAPSKPTTDRVLEAVPIGKVCTLGRVWAGDLKPILDAHVGTLKPLVTPFTIGNELDAEPIPGVKPFHRERPLQHVPLEPKPTLGRTFGDNWRSTRDHIAKVVDAMREQIRGRAKRDDDTDPDDTVDLGPVMSALTELRDQANNGHPNAVGAAIASLSGAIADAKPRARSTGSDEPVKFTDNGGRLPEGGVTRAIADFRAGRTTDGRTRGPMSQAIATHRREQAAKGRDIDPWDGPDAA